VCFRNDLKPLFETDMSDSSYSGKEGPKGFFQNRFLYIHTECGMAAFWKVNATELYVNVSSILEF
jgi:hypothetical protein